MYYKKGTTILPSCSSKEIKFNAVIKCLDSITIFVLFASILKQYREASYESNSCHTKSKKKGSIIYLAKDNT